jgi:23S rRNA (adenine2503-C2)-methyltransferase
METDKGYIEAGDVFMSQEKGQGTRPYQFSDFDTPCDESKRVMTISTMVGCPCHCRFCSCRNTFKRNLTAFEIAQQVYLMEATGFLQHRRNLSAGNSKEFRVLFTRMGEPMLNSKNVIEGIRRLIANYPNITIGMSTSGYVNGLEEFLACPDILPFIDMQFSMHSCLDRERDYLFDTSNNMDIALIAHYTNLWFLATGKKVGLNFIMFDGFDYDFEFLLEQFDRDQIWVRLSPWNVLEDNESEFRSLLKTEDVLTKKPVSSENLAKAIESLDRSGISYSYAPAIDEEVKNNVACGQALEAFKSTVGRDYGTVWDVTGLPRTI